MLLHKFDNGEEKSITFTSHSLASAEKQYSQLEKAIVFGVKHFHQYMHGQWLTILSDHKPLQGLFRETSGFPTLVSACIQHWALTLSAYNYNYEIKQAKFGKHHTHAKPPSTARDSTSCSETVLLMNVQ